MQRGSHRRLARLYVIGIILIQLAWAAARCPAAQTTGAASAEDQLVALTHRIGSDELMGTVRELCDPKYDGRLTGTPGYDAAVELVIDRLRTWGYRPGGEDGRWTQDFHNPYTQVMEHGALALRLPAGADGWIEKAYRYEDEYYPGATSGTGEVTAEVIYAGYGITAPELGYDDYAGVDVRGKIVLVDVEAPVAPDAGADAFLKWRPYSFHQYKVANAWNHGAAGMLYHYHIVNPNCAYIPGLGLTYVSRAVVDDLFAGAGRDWKGTVAGIRKNLQPASFATGKTVRMSNRTEHHSAGVGRTVIGWLEGADPVRRHETIVVAAHLDFLGRNPELLVGANDNASGVAVVLAVARALAQSPVPPGRSVAFVFFGAEEQGVRGSEFYLEQPLFPLAQTVACLNFDGVGVGEEIRVLAGLNFPKLWDYFDRANGRWVHRTCEPSQTANLGRQRLDAAHFLKAGIPTLSFSTGGGPEGGPPTYHTTRDRPEILNPEIMEDLARIVFRGLVELAADDRPLH